MRSLGIPTLARTIGLALASLVFVPTFTASAQESLAAAPSAPVPPEGGTQFTAWDGVGASLAGDAGLVGGLLLSAHLLQMTCNADYEDDCEITGLDLAVLSLAGIASVAGGVAAYGLARGHRGSYFAALGGASLGSLAMLGVFAIRDEGATPDLGTIALFTLPTIGAVLGYYLSVESESSPPPPTSGALLDLGRDGAIRFSLPDVRVRTSQDGVVVTLSLIGGEF